MGQSQMAPFGRRREASPKDRVERNCSRQEAPLPGRATRGLGYPPRGGADRGRCISAEPKPRGVITLSALSVVAPQLHQFRSSI
jgi:hypothetical protein